MIRRHSESRMLRALKRMSALSGIEPQRWDQLVPFISFADLGTDEVLFEAGSPGTELYFVIDGDVELHLDRAPDLGGSFYLHSRCKGETVGDFAALNGGTHLVSAIAKKPSHVAVFPREAFELLTNIHPTLIELVYDSAADLSHRVMLARIYLSLFGNMPTAAMNELLDATSIHHYRNGDVLFRQGDDPDGLRVVVSGRLHVDICRRDGSKIFSGEIFAPEPVGELALISDGLRSATVTASRESTVAFLNQETFTRLIAQNAERLLSLSRVMVKRHTTLTIHRRRTRDRTFVIVPLDSGLPLRRFTQQLKRELRIPLNPLVFDSSQMDKMYGRPGAAQTRVGDKFNSSISNWLEDKENTFDAVVYIADSTWTPWTRRCLNRADRVLFLADGSMSGNLGGSGAGSLRRIEHEVDGLFVNPETRPKRELILLHPVGTVKPENTLRWLKPRKLDAFHHVRLDDKVHLARLARRMVGGAHGIVFSGGGARGYAHLGVHRYIEEQNMPIDYIGGSSMGALLGASMAMGQTAAEVYELSKQFANKKALYDYTLPLASLFKSSKLTYFCKAVYGNDRIEDLWIPFFCVSSNLSDGQEVIHDQGSLWRAIRTTVSLPGVFAPVPTKEGELLIDGAVLNTFPVDIMRDRLGWQSELVGVNVSQITEMQHQYDYGTSISGWSVMLQRLNPFVTASRIPRLVETLLRATDIKGIERLEELKRRLDLLIEPDVSEIALMDFRSFSKIADIGYEAARVAFEEHDSEVSAAVPESPLESALGSELTTR